MSAASDPALVAAGHPVTADAAASILRAGGNAFDAIVSAGFAAAVAEPTLTGLAGGGFLMAHRPGDEPALFDFFVDTPGLGGADVEPHFVPITITFPSSTQDFNIGWGSAATPGVLAGYLHVHARLGRLGRASVVAPAIEAARSGVVLNDWQASLIELLEPILTASTETSSVFARDGHLLRAGDRLVNPALADFLEAVGAGEIDGFHEPAVADAVAAACRSGDGLLTVEDLAAYRVVERSPLRVSYGDVEVVTNPSPAFGGELVALALDLSGDRLDVGGASFGSSDHLCAVRDVMIEVDRRRRSAPVTRPQQVRGTTHISVADHDGNVASMTTSNGEGAGCIAPGTGVMLNNMLGEDDLHPVGFHRGVPGERVASMMSPTLVLADGEPLLALGSGGSKRIRTAITQVVQAVVDHGLDLADAVEAPRVHWDGEVLQVEPGFDDSAIAALAALGPVNLWDERNLYFGGVHAVAPGRTAAGDPRRGGCTRSIESGE